MTGSTFLNQIGLGGFDLGYLLIGMTVTILLLLIFLILLITFLILLIILRLLLFILLL